MQDFEALTGLIYDAALDASLWPAVLGQVADAMGGGAVALLFQNQITKRGTGVTARLDPGALGAFYAHFAHCNPLTRGNDLAKMRAAPQLPIITDRHVLPKSEYMRTEYYNDFALPGGMHASLMISLLAHEDSAATVNVMRPLRAGDFDDAEIRIGRALQPHLTRAFVLSLRLGEAGRTADALHDALDRSPHAIFLLGAEGRVRRANASAETLLAGKAGFRIVDRELAAASPEATRKLRALIAAAVDRDAWSQDGGARAGGSLSLAAGAGRYPLSVIVAPVGRENSLFATGPSAMVCISDPNAGVALPAQRLRDLFGLTAAEAQIALELLAGHDTRATADRLGIAFNTARVHVARILDKTETGRQSELVRLLMRLVGMVEA